MEIPVVVNALRRIIDDLTIFSDGRNVPEDTLDAFIVALEFSYRELVVLDTLGHLDAIQRQSIVNVRSALSICRALFDARSTSGGNFHFEVVHSGCPGRPTLQIPEEQLTFLIENNFTVPQIADMLGVSLRTIRRRMSEYGLSIRRQYSGLLDQDLDTIVSEVQQQFPMCGNRQMQGHLLARGYRVQQLRIRESQRRVDPAGTVLRRLHVLNRREYSVPAPLSLYHIDGHHKLIRYSLFKDLV